MKNTNQKLVTKGFVQTSLINIIVLTLFMLTTMVQAQEVELLEESTMTNEGLYFWYPNGAKAFHYNPNISPRGDCFTVVNGYVFMGWYKGGMSQRNLMISRKKIGSGNWVTVEFSHKNTLIGAGSKWGDSHKTISVGVSKIDGTVHVFYDHHNEALNYIVSKKNIAFAADKDFKLANFEPTRENLAPGQNIRITYPKITQNENGEVIVNYRAGAAVGGSEIVHVYNGVQWTRSKQITDGRPGTLAQNPNRIGWNYAYGVPYYNNGEVYYAFSVRWAEKKDQGILNEGIYLAKTGPTFSDKWEDLNGVKHDLPIVDFSPFLVANPPSNNGKGSSGGAGLVVSENGDVHITYDGRGSGNTYKYTYTRKAGQRNFTRHDGVIRTGMSWNNRFYTANASGNKISISSGEPGTVNYRSELVVETNRDFGVSSSYIDDGKLVVMASENKQSDKKDIYCYVFQLPAGDITPPSNLPPIVSITAPANNSMFEVGQEIAISALASDPDGTISKVNFKIDDAYYKQDTQSPYSQIFTPTAPGTYKIAARAFDNENDQTEVFVTITVTEKNIAPTASFTTPTESVLNEGYPELVITVDATDPNGDDITMLLKINGQEVRSESVAPYEWGHAGSPNPLETVGLGVGDHLIEAIVTDDRGLSTTISRTITIDRITSTSSTLGNKEDYVFPNPSETGMFQLKSETNFKVYTARGVYMFTGNSAEVDLIGYPKGIYLLKIDNHTIKLIK